jgi:selenium metabolism protein YedF
VSRKIYLEVKLMSVQVDCRGLNCPVPVIQTKQAIESNPEELIITIVDNEAARENVKKLAENMGYQVTIEEKEGTYHLRMERDDTSEIKKEAKKEEKPTDIINAGSTVIYIPTDKMGVGSDELGQALMKSYVYALMEAKPYPETLLFVNSGVNLTTEGSPVLEHLKILADAGVEILSCGTCLDFFELKERLAVGNVTNMYTIVEKMNQAGKVIRI